MLRLSCTHGHCWAWRHVLSSAPVHTEARRVTRKPWTQAASPALRWPSLGHFGLLPEHSRNFRYEAAEEHSDLYKVTQVGARAPQALQSYLSLHYTFPSK